jgi:uncharacterized surface protein with fasciclin (FAS1) repeats
MTTITQPATIVEAVVASSDHSTLLAAVKAAGLAEALSGSGEFTLFAPTDAAFAKLPSGTVESLLAQPSALAEILKYHVVSGRHEAAEVVGASEYMTLEGHPVHISLCGGGVCVEGATITATDIGTGNGVVHVIDSVMIPSES